MTVIELLGLAGPGLVALVMILARDVWVLKKVNAGLIKRLEKQG